jgi:uncharacterized protein involved in outer membrane biogenesis
MPDPVSITAFLLTGANIVGTEVVKEATKDAYRALKGKIGELFGQRASKALTKAEDPATCDEGREELEHYVGPELEADEAIQLQPFIEALLRAIKEDASATRIAQTRVGLDIEAGGNALIRDIQDAVDVAVKVRAKKDVTIEGIRMSTGIAPGK